ncbi:MAG: YaiI/YqxD family protein [Acetobacteraceae bacterium]|nr:YaiI/YqxD family protein [Acetobacteraceae bacterium]
MTTIHVDGDACPVREEVFRVATRLGLPVVVVSNGSRPVRPPGLPNVEMVIVSEGADAADDWIVERIGRGDVCVTADIPLAARCLAKGARALSPKGRAWTTDNIGGALAGREVARSLREMGVATGGPAPLTRADRSRFLAALDAEIQAARRDAATPPPRPWVPFE